MGAEQQPGQVWSGTVDGHEHRVAVFGSVRRRIHWTIDGETVADTRTMDDRARVDGGERGRLLVIHSTLGTPQRATVHPPGQEVKGLTGLGGTDLTPEEGSKAAAYERKVLEHPKRYALLQTVGSAGGVAIGLLAAVVFAWLARVIPRPDVDLPDIPFPDLPSIPWPDLPSIPWPDLPDISLPGWVQAVLDQAGLIVPVVIALVLALSEIRRRRRQAEERAASSGSTPAEQEDQDSRP